LSNREAVTVGQSTVTAGTQLVLAECGVRDLSDISIVFEASVKPRPVSFKADVCCFLTEYSRPYI